MVRICKKLRKRIKKVRERLSGPRCQPMMMGLKWSKKEVAGAHQEKLMSEE